MAKGYSQTEGVDFKETFAPVVKYKSLRLLLAVANERDMHVHQMDVTTAYLNGDLEEEIYMKSPSGELWRLQRSLYGLKQAPRCWNKKIHDFLEGEGFKRHISDYATYSKGEGRNQTILTLYVDDLLILSENPADVVQIKDALSSRFEMVDFGEVNMILGMRVLRDREKGILTIDQEQYAQEVLKRFGMENCKPVSTPLPTDAKMVLSQGATSEEERREMEAVPYRQAIGSLMYLMVSTRPDIAAAVGILSRFMENPGRIHWEGVKRVLRYV